MAAIEYGIEGVVAEDRAYAGSRYKDVRDAVFADPYPNIFSGDGHMPTYDVTLKRLLGGILPFGQSFHFRDATARAVDSFADLRWGPDGKGFRRLVHPNGICHTGRWTIHEQTPYTGYFATGSSAIVVGRYSTCCTETKRGQTRSLSLVGKLFPTTDPFHLEPLRTANFFTQEDIGGAKTEFINDAELRNAPDTTLANRGAGIPLLMTIGLVFRNIDQQPSMRQVYPIAELGKPEGTPTRAPQFMRLLVAPDQPRIPGKDIDFREEIMAQIFDKGDPFPKRTLTYIIELTDEGETTGPASRERRTFKNWRKVGTLTFDNAIISHNGDSVIHFSHPTWRNDRNDSATATRINGKKIRS